MVKSFHCPSCQAPIEFEGEKTTVRCEYCGNTVIVPESLRGRPAKDTATPPTPVVSTVHSSVGRPEVKQAAAGAGGCALTIFLITIGIVIAGGIVAYSIFSNMPEIGELTGERDIPGLTSEPTATPNPTATPGLASPVLEFGGEGVGVGRLDDARELGVDSAGNVYVADYSSGRIQVFDAQGEYLRQWQVVNDINPVTSMSVRRDGTVYVNQGFDVGIYNGATGEFLGNLTYQSDDPTLVLEDSVPLPDGGLLVNERGWFLKRLDPQGAVLQTMEVPNRDQGSHFRRATVDGQGNIYALGRFHQRGNSDEVIFRFAPDGAYISSFGSSGNEPGQIGSANDIAVDAQGNVYISDSIHGIQVFTPDGRYLGVIEVEGVAFGITVDEQGALWVTNRQFVYKLQPQIP